MSGFINIAKALKGVQIGFINCTDSIESGVMIGFLSFARNGYHHVEFEVNESIYGTLNFKTGTKRFYNILYVGGSVTDNDLYWGFGYGVGTMFYFTQKLVMSVDLMISHINKEKDLLPDFHYLFLNLKPPSPISRRLSNESL
ncbi:MAG: hypothetical protein ACJAZ2_002282 [Glaciecola sp.]